MIYYHPEQFVVEILILLIATMRSFALRLNYVISILASNGGGADQLQGNLNWRGYRSDRQGWGPVEYMISYQLTLVKLIMIGNH